MLYDPLAVKRLASAVCVITPTPRSLIGPSGCQGCESSSTTESAREPGLDAGAPGRLYCGPSQEEEQQRPVVGHGIVLRSMSQPGEPGEGERTSLRSRTLQHRAIPEERPSDLPRSAATYRGHGGLCPPAAWDTTALDVRHEPASFPCWRSACHAPGSHPPASVWLFRTSNRALRYGETPPLPEEAHGGSGAVPRSREGGGSRPGPPRANAK